MKNDTTDKAERRGRILNDDAVFYPVPDAISKMPDWYGGMLEQIKECVTSGRTHVMWEANAMMTMMYYHIGKSLLRQSQAEG